MIELTIAAPDADALIKHVTGGKTELCAVLYTSQYVRKDGVRRLLVREVSFPAPGDYSRMGELEVELKPDFVAKASKHARLEGVGIVFVHSHPGSFPPEFSAVDDDGEQHLAAFLAHRNPGVTHLALVVSRGGVACRVLGASDPIRVISVGNDREVLTGDSNSHVPSEARYDRQVRAFGIEGHKALQQTRIAIVGLGGTGSIVAQQLVHLGVRDFILIDPDTIDETNLNRVANAKKKDVGQAKVEVASRYLMEVNSGAQVEVLQGNIVREKYARALTNADLIFGCTDSHGSRAVIQQVSYQYLIPCIDIGSTIVVANGSVLHIIGRVQMLTPSLGCFTCSNLLDYNEVRRDMMSEYERRLDPYLQGVHQPAPSVMSLNGTVSSLGVTMFLSHVAHVPAPARNLVYDAIATKLRAVQVEPAPNCYVCSRSGGFARADTHPLNVRHD